MNGEPAYAIDGRPVARAAFYSAACDPRRSVVVEACAGAGKTWMLVSRILRALLDGAEPSQIVAITFTRKAAGEMRQRLDEWLAEHALEADAPDAAVGADAADAAASADAAATAAERRIAALRERGLDAAAAAALAPALGALHRRVLEAGQGVQVLTFHAWFAQLLMHSPLALRARLGLPARYELIEDTSPLRPALLRRFHDRVRRDEALRLVYMDLVARHGRHGVLEWLGEAWAAAGDLLRADAAGVLDDAVPPAAALWPECAAFDSPLALLATPALRRELAELARELGRSKNSKPQDAARGLQAALHALDAGDFEGAFELAFGALFTEKGQPRKQLGNPPGLGALSDRLQALRSMQAQQLAHLDHRALVALSRLLLAEYAALKRERGLVDMDDLDRVALHLLGEGEHAAWLQERLDLRLRHLLIDEFQDTSPAQWQVLRGWLEAYAGAGGGASGQRPLALFVVGDPKQSIYRFRGAEPRVFVAARELVVQALGGQALSCDHTRRSAPAVVAAVNAVFEPVVAAAATSAATGSGVGGTGFGPFRAHTTESEAIGGVWQLPRLARPEKPLALERARWRDSLTEPRHEPEHQRRAAEAAQAARAVAALVHPDGPWRLAPDDVMVLARRRVMLGEMAAALAAAGVPHALAEPLELMAVPEVLDLVAVLDVLASPGHDLALARALKSPLFGADDAALLALSAAARSGGAAPRAWFDALLAASWPAHPALDRARGLLAAWQGAVTQLPPHDLLDRIVHEADAMARFAAAVPAARRVFALQAVEALLAAALEHDGGRFASAYGFVRELRAGRVRADRPTAAGAVRLLTVHGAKGLEARAVLLLDCDPTPNRSSGPRVLIDWPAEETAPRSAAFVRNERDAAPSLAGIVERRRLEEAREELNALYVAMTRAREWLIVSATEPHQRGPGPSWWERLVPHARPWEEAPGESPRAANDDKVAVAAESEVECTLPDLPAWPGPPAEARVPARPDAGQSDRAAVPDGARETAWDTARDIARDTPRDAAAALLGQALHRVLEWAGNAPAARAPWTAAERARACSAAAAAFGLAAAARPRLRQAVDAILDSAECAPFFDRAALRWAGNEVVLAAAGEVLRLDRLVLRDEAGAGPTWWVLDYKLEAEPERDPALCSQLRRYRAAVAAAQPGAVVRAAFITGQGRRVELAEVD
jgi:ATP-dependent helicase/nuclease subunit A